MTDLVEFERELKNLIGPETGLRPFVCDGSPLQCSVFIVGFNPATEMKEDFWQFWRSDYGFKKEAWFEEYKRERERRPLRPGKTRRNAVSNTRRVIDWVVAAAYPVRCLETNIYPSPTEQAADLASKQRATALFDFLLNTINPSVIVAHGDKAVEHVQSMKPRAYVIEKSHFSRGWSQARARSLGEEIRAVSEDARV